MKLCLGTVQFGMDYGIVNQKMPAIEESIKMLDYATQNGINTIDTAFAYGIAEDVVGEFLKRKTINREKLFISSKFKPNDLDDVAPEHYIKVIKEHLNTQLKRLNTDYLDSYMFHSSRYAFNELMLKALNEIKKDGKIKHCGVSVYYPDEARMCIESEYVDFIQLPFSIFDQRMLKDGIFNFANEKKDTIIHSRSAFIQGLILMNETEVPSFLNDAKPIVRKIDELCKKYNISRISLAINYVKQFNVISHLVFGVDNLEQLKENIRTFDESLPVELLLDVSKEFKNLDTNIIMPSLWCKK